MSNAPTRSPAVGGPTTYASSQFTESREFAASKSSSATTRGTRALSATSVSDDNAADAIATA
ncbi:hypothetical protein [Saccharothrix sp. ALI-22-I]|uniref:hypothetical protein n=1 Tax=Saccharothrix sp. ALI-22-I TaxID=1933778 RepID=UPI000A007049|nr:hypothetical protein [Saccharothrix sp. ALI-22-I]